jgi:hypothetical protein
MNKDEPMYAKKKKKNYNFIWFLPIKITKLKLCKKIKKLKPVQTDRFRFGLVILY